MKFPQGKIGAEKTHLTQAGHRSTRAKKGLVSVANVVFASTCLTLREF